MKLKKKHIALLAVIAALLLPVGFAFAKQPSSSVDVRVEGTDEPPSATSGITSHPEAGCSSALSNSDWDEFVQDFSDTMDSIVDGVEMGSVSFYPFSANPMHEVYAVPLIVHRNADGSIPNPTYAAHIILDPDKVLRSGVESSRMVSSTLESGLVNVEVKFNASVGEHAKNMQVKRDFAEANDFAPSDLGIAVVHNNKIIGAFPYGVIAEKVSNDDWITVGYALDSTEATALLGLLQ